MERAQARFLVISFSSDWLYPSYQSQEMVRALRVAQSRRGLRANCRRTTATMRSWWMSREQTELVRGFLASTFEKAAHDAPTAAAEQAFVSELLGRSDYAIIGEIVEPGTKVLDLGCGEGELLSGWPRNKGVDARGVEISGAKVQRAIARGVSVSRATSRGAGRLSRPGLRLRDPQPDAAGDAPSAASAARDAARGPPRHRGVPEFRPLARAPVDADQRAAPRARKLFPHEWYDSPNIHFLTVRRFRRTRRQLEALAIERRYFLAGIARWRWQPNLLAEVAVYLLVAAIANGVRVPAALNLRR